MSKLAAVFAVLAATGCLSQTDEASSADAVGLSQASAQQVLDLVNYPGTDVTTLDVAAGLDARAAANIISTRNGADGVSPTSDDRFFETITQLDAISQVGDSALQKLAAYAAAHPAPAGEIVKGITFHGWEDEAVIAGVNAASIAELDAMLDDRAAASLFAARPFTSVAQMGTLSYVGASALDKLLGGAPGWWAGLHGVDASHAGRFDGAVFDEAEAVTALEIVNQATLADLTGHGITTSAATKIIANRAYTSLAQVAAVSGVGAATMNALLAYAQSGAWGAVSCTDSFDAAVGPHLADVLFLSESDRAFDLVSFPGAGTSAPTAASLLALLGRPSGTTTHTRAVSSFFSNIEPSSSAADPTAAAVIEAAVDAQLSDVIYVAIGDGVTLDVYLVGRTTCGDLVGLHSIAIET